MGLEWLLALILVAFSLVAWVVRLVAQRRLSSSAPASPARGASAEEMSFPPGLRGARPEAGGAPRTGEPVARTVADAPRVATRRDETASARPAVPASHDSPRRAPAAPSAGALERIEALPRMKRAVIWAEILGDSRRFAARPEQ